MNLRIFVCLMFLVAGGVTVFAQTDRRCDVFYHGANHRLAGRWDQAIADLTKAIDLKCELGRAYLLRGEARWGKKDYDGAWADATKAIPLLDEPALGHRLRGQLAFARSDLKAALTEFSRSIKLDPEAVPTYIYRAETHEGLGDIDSAIADYARVVALGGESSVPEKYLARAKAYLPKPAVSAHYTRGIELYNEGKIAEALASLTKAIAAESKRPEYLAARAKVNIQLRKIPAAMLDLDRAITLGGTHEAYTLRANIHIERGSYDKAVIDLERGMQLLKGAPEDSVLLNHDATLAGAYELLGKPTAFKPSRDAETRQYYFINYLYDDAKSNNYDKLFGLALAKFSSAIAFFPDKVEFLAERGQIWLELGKPQLGLADFDRSLVIAPKVIYVHIYRSKAFHAMKRYADAFEAADIAISRLPDDDPSLADAYAARAAANCALGKKQAAAEDEGAFGMLADAGQLKTRCH